MTDTYSYPEFCAGVARLHGSDCWVGPVLERRLAAVPRGLTVCDGRVDGHHLISKQRIKARFPFGAMYGLEDWFEPADRYDRNPIPVGDLLNDPRNGVPVCRRHHDLLERALVRLFRGELPSEVEEFAYAVGMVWSLERDYPVRVVSAGELPGDVVDALHAGGR